MSGYYHSSQLGRWWRQLTAGELWRPLGWFLTSFCSLVIIVEAERQVDINVWASFGLLIGVGLIVYASGFLGHSESTRLLLQEARAGKRVAAHHLHGSKRPTGSVASLSLFAQIGVVVVVMAIVGVYSLALLQIKSAELAGFLIPVLFGIGYALLYQQRLILWLSTLAAYLILALYHPSLLAAILLAGLTGLLVAQTWKNANWPLLFFSLIATFGLLFSWLEVAILQYFTPVGEAEILPPIITLLGLAAAVTFLLPWVYRRRQAGERLFAGLTIFLSTGLYLFFLLPWQEVLPVAEWWWLFAGFLTTLAGLAWLAWSAQRRFSYAKYYLLALLEAVVVPALIQLDYGTVTLLWFCLSVLLLSAGFLWRSYTARLTGLFFLLVTGAYYFAYIVLPASVMTSEVLVRERLWQGLLLVLFLPVVANWYADLGKTESEYGQRKLIMEALLSTAFLLFVGLVFTTLPGVYLTLAWLVIAVAGWLTAKRYALPFLTLLGGLLFLLCLAKLFLVDTQLLAPAYQLAAAGLFGGLLLILSYCLWRFPSLLSIPNQPSS